MQPSVPFAAPCVPAALRWCAVAAGALIAAQAQAQPVPAAPDMRQPLPASCIAEAQAIVRAAFTEGVSASAALQRVPAATAGALAREGFARGSLNLHSLISPPSSFELYQLPSAGAPRDAQACPLHETYLGYRQGGLLPQPVRFYGPLRAAGG